jgi:hypothetical protein
MLKMKMKKKKKEKEKDIKRRGGGFLIISVFLILV